MYGHVITKFLGWVDLLTHDAPLANASRCARAPLTGVFHKWSGEFVLISV